ncbi:MAG: RecX family transcriptional regulator [Alphaproteobacteria bacterium]|nr:RecX family transcriptional regulator [Alphaproteobacteria bacterium]
MENDPDERPRAGRRRPPKPATPERLEKAAYHYLERFATSADNLRRVLMRRVERSARAHGTDRQAGAAAVDALVARFLAAGLLDDRAYAEARAASLHRQGKGVRAIRQALAQKGVAAEDADAALDALIRDRTADPDAFEGGGSADGRGGGAAALDRAAAAAYARRRRLGPYRLRDREESRERDLAALGRRGFSYDVARLVIEAEDPESLEARLEEEDL